MVEGSGDKSQGEGASDGLRVALDETSPPTHPQTRMYTCHT